MRNFRTLEQAKKDLQIIQDYIDLIENYQPESLEQHTIYIYSLVGNVIKTAELLNHNGFRIDGRLIEPNEISELITSRPAKDDLLHKKIKSLYLKKTRANRRVAVRSYY